MAIDQQDYPAAASQPPPVTPDREAGALRRSGKTLGTWVWRSAAIAWKVLLATYVLLAMLFLILRYAVLPNIGMYKGDIEQIATRTLGRSVSIAAIDASWHGLQPHLQLSDVVLKDAEGRQALRLPSIAATVSWWSAAVADLRFASLEITGAELDIRRSAQGTLFLAGMPMEKSGSSDGKALEWILSQREIVIRGARVRWNDELRSAPSLVLDDVNLLLHNQWRHHRLGLRARPPEALAAPLDIRADFVHPTFTRNIGDVSQWRGELYADVKQTDLAGWKTYADYPFEVRQGNGAVRAWLTFDRGRVANFTADLLLSDVLARLEPSLPPLDLVKVAGRVAALELFPTDVAPQTPESPGFAEHGHAVALQNFSMQSRDGLVLPNTTVTERFVPARGNQPQKVEVSASVLDLKALADFASHLPLRPLQRRLLEQYSPRGRLSNFSAQWQGAYPDISSYQVKGQFLGLGLRAPDLSSTPAAQATSAALPGFENLSGEIDANQQGGALSLASAGLVLHLPGYLDNPDIPFERLNMQANWSMQDKNRVQARIDQLDLAIDGLAATLNGRHTIDMAGANKAGPSSGKAAKNRQNNPTELTARIAKLDINKVARYLPAKTPPALRSWLSGALLGGVAHDALLVLKGDLSRFPFRTEKPGEKPAGVFTVAGKIEQGSLNYAPSLFGKDGKTPLWPVLEQVKGSFIVDRTKLEIHGDTAKTLGAELSNVTARVPDLIAKDPILEIDGQASAPMQEFVRYVNSSPVLGWIYNFTEDTKASGSAKLALKLQLPLHHMVDAKVQGTVTLANNEINLFRGLPALSQSAGKLEFTEKGLNLNGVKAVFLGGPVVLTGGASHETGVQIKASGSAHADGLRKAYPSAALQPLIKRISGGTRYAVTIGTRNRQPEIIVESSLQGLGLDFPAPLRKSAAESLPIRFQLAGLPGNASLARDEMRISLGTNVQVRYQRQKTFNTGAAENAWQVVRGGIAVNAPLPEPDRGLAANVDLPSLDLDAWRALGGAPGEEGGKTEASSSESAALSEYVEPDMLAARTGKLIVMGKTLDNVVVGASHQKKLWQANIDSAQASGHLAWNEGEQGELGQVTARFSNLIIPQSTASSVTDLLEGKSTSARIPALDVSAEHFELLGKNFGRLVLVANNASVPTGREWRINRLAIVNPDAQLKATGRWAVKGGESMSILNYELDIDNAGRLLERLGFPNLLRGGEGSMQGELHWNGLPYSMDFPSLSGQLQLNLERGQFLKVDAAGAGASKLLGVLSLQALPRRLTLDFRDVFSQGFAFDGITATAAIDKGILKTDNLKMRSVSATVLMDGSADLVKETQNLHVAVLPDVNMGAASVLYGLAVNPVIGVGTFLAQLFLREPLMRALTFEYDVTGPWKDPVVAKRARHAAPQ